MIGRIIDIIFSGTLIVIGTGIIGAFFIAGITTIIEDWRNRHEKH